MHNCFRIIAINMEDRRFDHFCNIRRIRRRTRKARIGGKADLIVDYDVNGPTGFMPDQTRKAETLRDDTLPGKRGVTMQQQRNNGAAIGHAARVGLELVLLGARLAQYHRINGFQMRRVRRQRQMHLIAIKFAIG